MTAFRKKFIVDNWKEAIKKKIHKLQSKNYIIILLKTESLQCCAIAIWFLNAVTELLINVKYNKTLIYSIEKALSNVWETEGYKDNICRCQKNLLTEKEIKDIIFDGIMCGKLQKSMIFSNTGCDFINQKIECWGMVDIIAVLFILEARTHPVDTLYELAKKCQNLRLHILQSYKLQILSNFIAQASGLDSVCWNGRDKTLNMLTRAVIYGTTIKLWGQVGMCSTLKCLCIDKEVGDVLEQQKKLLHEKLTNERKTHGYMQQGVAVTHVWAHKMLIDYDKYNEIVTALYKQFSKPVWVDLSHEGNFSALGFKEQYSNKDVIIVDKLCSACVPGRPENLIALAICDWNKRGWTYQEAAFAGRLYVWSSYKNMAILLEHWLGNSHRDDQYLQQLWNNIIGQFQVVGMSNACYYMSQRYWRKPKDRIKCIMAIYGVTWHELIDIESLTHPLEYLLNFGYPNGQHGTCCNPEIMCNLLRNVMLPKGNVKVVQGIITLQVAVYTFKDLEGGMVDAADTSKRWYFGQPFGNLNKTTHIIVPDVEWQDNMDLPVIMIRKEGTHYSWSGSGVLYNPGRGVGINKKTPITIQIGGRTKRTRIDEALEVFFII